MCHTEFADRQHAKFANQSLSADFPCRMANFGIFSLRLSTWKNTIPANFLTNQFK